MQTLHNTASLHLPYNLRCQSLLTSKFKMAAKAAASDELPAMSIPFKNPKFIFFTDFDGTITLQDSNDYMVFTARLS